MQETDEKFIHCYAWDWWQARDSSLARSVLIGELLSQLSLQVATFFIYNLINLVCWLCLCKYSFHIVHLSAQAICVSVVLFVSLRWKTHTSSSLSSFPHSLEHPCYLLWWHYLKELGAWPKYCSGLVKPKFRLGRFSDLWMVVSHWLCLKLGIVSTWILFMLVIRY